MVVNFQNFHEFHLCNRFYVHDYGYNICSAWFFRYNNINLFVTGKYIEYQLKYDPLAGTWSITKSKTCLDQLADQLKGTQLS